MVRKNNNETIKYHTFTSKWGNKEWCKNFAVRIDSWLSNFEEPERPMMLALLKNYLYYSEFEVNKRVVALYNEFISRYSIKDDRVFASTSEKKDYGVGFSDIVFSSFWSRNNLYDCSENNLLGLVKTNNFPKNIVFVDDYSGSGDTFISLIKKLTQMNSEVINHDIYFLTICISSTALKNIAIFAKEQGISIKVVYTETQERAFLDNKAFDEATSKINREKYIKACTDLQINYYVLGYKEIEALVSFEYNTPNNTLAAFWYEMDDFIALFKRKNTRSPQLSELRRNAQKKHALYGNPPVIFDAEDYQTNLFMVYCLCQGRKFSISKACIDFGMTIDQIDEKLTLMFSLGYLKYFEGRPVATAKLNQYLFHSRLKDFNKAYDELREGNKVPEYDFDNDTYIPKDFAKRFKGYK